MTLINEILLLSRILWEGRRERARGGRERDREREKKEKERERIKENCRQSLENEIPV